MNKIIRTSSYALLAGCLIGCAQSAVSSASHRAPTTAPLPAPKPQYSIPYHRPDPKEVTKVLERVRNRLIVRMAFRLVDPATSQPYVDPPGADLTLGTREHMFGSVDYPSGVAYAGLLAAGDATGDKAYDDFVSERFHFLADTLPKFKERGRRSRNPLRNLVGPDSLDACGAIGAAFVKAQRAGLGTELQPVIDRFAKYVSKGQFRLEDGTLARNRPFRNSLWADDMYMSVPLLAQMGALTGQNSYFDDAARQVIQISARLFTPSTGLYTHAWNAQIGDDQPRYYWGRANGWCLMAMAELLDVMPENHPKRAEVLKQFRAHARGIASFQSGEGLWHQMLDRNDTYLETSCSAMFTFAIAKGVNRGWLHAGAYGPVAMAGWQALTTRIDEAGHVTGTCVGTTYAADYVYYYNRPGVDDVHGYGPVLMAGSEILRMMKNSSFRIQGTTTQPITLNERRQGATTWPTDENDDSTTQPAAVNR